MSFKFEMIQSLRDAFVGFIWVSRRFKNFRDVSEGFIGVLDVIPVILGELQWACKECWFQGVLPVDIKEVDLRYSASFPD